MGDMADYYIELGLNAGEGFAPKHRERRGYYGPRYSHRSVADPTCDHCGAKGLRWVGVAGENWRLYEGQKPHVCPTSADGFGEVPDA